MNYGLGGYINIHNDAQPTISSINIGMIMPVPCSLAKVLTDGSIPLV
jgi:hypothetical protein